MCRKSFFSCSFKFLSLLTGLQDQVLSTLSQELALAKASASESGGNLSEAASRALQLLEEVVEMLNRGLVDISDLYNKVRKSLFAYDLV